MSDCTQCTLPDPRKPTFREAQFKLHVTADFLDDLCRQIEEFSRKLPESRRTCDPLAQLRAAMECVRSDLLLDAVKTLRLAANLTEEQLKQRFEERQKWLVVVM